MGRLLKGAAALLGVLTAAEAGGTAYFYRRTMMRYNAKTETDDEDVRRGLGKLFPDHA